MRRRVRHFEGGGTAAVAALIYSAIAGGLSAIPVIGGLCSLFVDFLGCIRLYYCKCLAYVEANIDFGVFVEALS